MDIRDRSRDVLVIDVKSGNATIDNTWKYFGLYHLWRTFPGTVEYEQIQQERRTQM